MCHGGAVLYHSDSERQIRTEISFYCYIYMCNNAGVTEKRSLYIISEEKYLLNLIKTYFISVLISQSFCEK